jgi:diacylglycerol kinase
MLKKYFSRFPNAWRGITYALINDFGYRTQVYLGVLLAFIVLAFLLPLTMFEVLFIVLAYTLILITELQNSAIEAALDKLHPELNDSIKHSKDMAAGAVLTAGIFLVIVLATIIGIRFFY